jgi:hypothetical protein
MFTALDGPGNAKAQKARLCALTFFCSKGDPHPTDAGYRAMADAFMTALGYTRTGKDRARGASVTAARTHTFLEAREQFSRCKRSASIGLPQ